MFEFGAAAQTEWMLNPEITYLNHGTVGAPPRRVLAAQQAIRDEIERQPAEYILRELADVTGTGIGRVPRMREAAARVAAFLGADEADLGFVDNATTGVNGILRSMALRPGDEILVTDLGYGGVTNAAAFAARQAAAVVRTVRMPNSGSAPEQFTAAIDDAIGPRTVLALVDHITSHTALVLPIVDIVEACHARGVAVLVDGAHAPGSIALDIDSIGADWYVANLHKWMWTPRSSGITWVSRERRADLHPAVISWGLDNGLAAEFDLIGTRDPSPFLAAPAAIDMLETIGVQRVMSYNHDLAWWAGRHLADRWETAFSTPEEMIGTMVHVHLPGAAGATLDDARRLQRALLVEDRIEVPVFGDDPGSDGVLSLRVCAQVYNDRDQIEQLAAAVLARC